MGEKEREIKIIEEDDLSVVIKYRLIKENLSKRTSQKIEIILSSLNLYYDALHR